MSTGDVDLIGETIYSFNTQTYANRELIILDTHPQEMKFSEPLKANAELYRVPRAKFNTAQEKMKYALFLATVKGADYVAWFQPGDIYLPGHLSTLAGMIPEEHQHGDEMFPFRIGHMDKFFDSYAFPMEMTVQPHSVGIGGWIHEHVSGHATNFDAPFGLPDFAYGKLPWHTIFLGGPILPGYIFNWTKQREEQAHLDYQSMEGQISGEKAFALTEDKAAAVDISNTPVQIGWKLAYEHLARNKFYGTSFDIPKSTGPLWTQSGRLGSGCCAMCSTR